MRFKEDIIERLKVLEWWNWTDEEILQNKDVFIHPLTEMFTLKRGFNL